MSLPRRNIPLLYEEETRLIREACFEVWKEFGGAFKEKIIDRSLVIALKKKGLRVDSQKKISYGVNRLL